MYEPDDDPKELRSMYYGRMWQMARRKRKDASLNAWILFKKSVHDLTIEEIKAVIEYMEKAR